MAAMGVVTLVLTVAAVGLILNDTYRAARRQAEQSSGNLVLSLERDIGRVVGSIDITLQATARNIHIPELAALPPDARRALVFSGVVPTEGLGAVFITNAQGDIVDDSDETAPKHMNVGDRAYFTELSASADSGLVISAPVRNRADGTWTLIFARRMSRPDGTFEGIVGAGIKLSLIRSLFNSLDLGLGGSVILSATNGTMIVRQPYNEDDVGRSVPDAPVLRQMARTHSTFGNMEALSRLDQQTRLISYRQIGSYPLVLSVGYSQEQVFADWTRKAIALGIVIACLLGVSLIMAVGLTLELRLRTEAERRAQSAADAALRSERELADALVQLDALFQHSTDALFVARVEPNGACRYESVNPKGVAFMTAPDSGVIGLTPSDCFAPAVAATILAHWRTCIERCEPVSYSVSASEGETRRDWETVLVPILDAAGRVRRLIGNARDVTERKLNDAMLRQAQKMEAVGQLTAGIAHEFNNMLQAVQGSLELIAEQGGLDGTRRAWVDEAARAAEYGATLTHRLLAFSRQQTLEIRETVLGEVLNDLSRLLPPLLGPRIHLSIGVAPRTEAAFIDGRQLEACLLNLAINARDAMPAGGAITIRAANADPDAPLPSGLPNGDYVCVVVEDTGTGMPDAIRVRAFDPFFTTKAIGKGSGLGLSMVQGFARQSGGEVSIRSIVDAGTAVTLWLPRHRPAAGSAPVETLPAAASAPQASAPPDIATLAGGAPRHVMVVDDLPGIRTLFARNLEAVGYQVRTFPEAKSALDALMGGLPCHLLITDQSMPGMSGIELLEQVARLRPALPAMIVTGYDLVSGTDRVPETVRVLRKPVRRGELIACVQAILAATDSHATDSHANETAMAPARIALAGD